MSVADSFWSANKEWITAVAAVLLAFVLAHVIDRAFRARVVRERVLGDAISAQTDTRLRFVRRLIYAAILVIGVAIALSQFTGINRIAASVLASGAIAAAIVGFAARQVLANFVAGIMLFVTQPLRVGDWVTLEDNYGEVVDVRLNYTILRTATEQRIIIPNERIAGGILRNDTLAVGYVGLDVAVWVPPEADADRAVRALEEETGAAVSVAEAVAWGVRLSVGGAPVPPPERSAREADLRARCLRRLRAEGLLPTGGAAGRL